MQQNGHLTNDNIFNQLLDKTEEIVVYSLKKNYSSGDKVTANRTEFYGRFFRIFEKFDDLEWTNILFAGGLLSGILEKKFDEELYKNSDVDLFVYGKDFTEVLDNIKKIYTYFKQKLPSLYAFKYDNSLIFTLISHEYNRAIQLIGVTQKFPIIIEKFDLSYCQVGFDGSNFIYTNEYLQTIKTRKTKILSNSVHLYRLIKCIQRGYSILKPMVNDEYKQKYIKNFFHTYIKDPVTHFNTNTDEYWKLEEINQNLNTILDNEFVKKNLCKHYLPKITETNEEIINNIKHYYSDKTIIIKSINDINSTSSVSSFPNVFK